MAKKKPRVPKPPSGQTGKRPVQAPQRREGPKRTRTDSGGLPNIPTWAWVAIVAAVAAVIAGVVVATKSNGSGSATNGSSSAAKAAMLAAGCTYKDVPPLPPKKNPLNYHADVPTLSTPTKGLWSTFPPSGGAHYGLWAVWDFYRQPVNIRQVVHNEEHGAVVIWWGPHVSTSTVNQLEAFYQQQPDGMFGTPVAGLGDKIALTAWTGDPAIYYQKTKQYPNGYYGIGHIAICKKFDQTAFAAFRKAYRGKGPEGIPLSADEPGCGPESTSGCG
jgi:Protein of unknown function (DUF3105)